MKFKKNDEVQVTITDYTNEGLGIGKVDGYPLFIKDAIIGDTVIAGITKVKKNYAFARLVKVTAASPDRVEPKCGFHKKCGGCQMQALSYEAQLVFKENKIRNNLVRIGGFSEDFVNEIMEPIIGMKEPFRYRNKAQYPVGCDRDGNLVTGFYAGRTHDIISNTDCYLGQACNREILETVLEWMKEENVSAYDEATCQGLVRHILIREGFYTGEIMVCLVVNLPGDGNADRGESGIRSCKLAVANPLIERLQSIPEIGKKIVSICLNYNNEDTNVILGRESEVLFGQGYITDTLSGITFRISPQSFYQVNPVQTEKLYGTALEYAGLTGEETVWDLYCGIGTISLFLSRKAKQVYGVEIVSQAIEDAKQNAALNGIKNAEFFVGKAEEVLPEKYEKENIYADVIVVDPPRKGCDEKCLETMIKMTPKRIVYVSCDSATLARDLKFLCEKGYEVKRVRGVDQFCHTVHVETCVLLEKTDVSEY
ncbi:MAG: 23S rRNA (uracil(1939)-C(5))-methyltransferase RlmD [Lachnospiraceae bacterium]|nr:23S rRNA (uracil(1939)-C(5))-methyltransferase RlmD [Lachnospiraceae bacterium]